MIYDVLFETCPWHTRVALFDAAGNLLKVHYDDPMRAYVEGAHVLGRVRKIVAPLNAAFVDIGDTVDGFLPLKSVPPERAKLTEGDELMVRVVQPRSEDKGAKLDGRVLVPRPDRADKVPLLVKEAPSALSRILMDAGMHPVRVWVVDGRYVAPVQELVQEEKIFHLYDHPDVDLCAMLDDQLSRIGQPRFALAGGGELVVELTKALTAIDVNSAQFKGQNKNWQKELNTIAAHAVVRLVNLLDVSGSIIVDFITMPQKEDRKTLRQLLIHEFNENDPRRVEVLEMSRFGLVELNREKSGESLVTLLKTPLFVAGAVCLALFRLQGSRKKINVTAHPEVVALLAQRFTTAAAMAYFGCPVVFAEHRSNDVQIFEVNY